MAAKRIHPHPTQARLRELFDYRDDGFFVSKKSGAVIRGSLQKNGYKLIFVENKKTLECYHRMVWLWHFGEVPAQIDHKNFMRSDNRVENLRPASPKQNQAYRRGNRERKISISSKGVDWSYRSNKPYRARIVRHGKFLNLGRYATELEAARAYDKVALSIDGKFAFGNEIKHDIDNP